MYSLLSLFVGLVIEYFNLYMITNATTSQQHRIVWCYDEDDEYLVDFYRRNKTLFFVCKMMKIGITRSLYVHKIKNDMR